jgi:hypothetical protein
LKKRQQGPRHFIIPDTQIREETPTDHLLWAARYAADKRPDVLVQPGDWHDMASLSHWDAGKKASYGRTYKGCVNAGNKGLDLFEAELRKHAPRSYKPRKAHNRGNHENRVWLADQNDPKASYSFDDFNWKKHGWEVYEFLDVAIIDQIAYTHYCCLNEDGNVTQSKNGAPNAKAQVRRMGMSTVCGHKQGLDIGFKYTRNKTLLGIIAGSFYLHDEGYLTPQGVNYWKGVVMLNDVRDGFAEPMPVSLDYLRRRYG